jgi:hypothetical protein
MPQNATLSCKRRSRNHSDDYGQRLFPNDSVPRLHHQSPAIHSSGVMSSIRGLILAEDQRHDTLQNVHVIESVEKQNVASRCSRVLPVARRPILASLCLDLVSALQFESKN